MYETKINLRSIHFFIADAFTALPPLEALTDDTCYLSFLFWDPNEDEEIFEALGVLSLFDPPFANFGPPLSPF
jgi:hypothetical protein